MTAWTPESTLKVRDVAQVCVSPDGRRIAYTVSDPVMTEDKSENVTQIYVADAAGGDATQVTFAAKSSGNPKWSPDGSCLAFTSNRTEKNNLYLLRMGGGEAEPLTDVKADVGSFAWSPDGAQIAFTMPDPKTEDEEKREKAKDDWRWMNEDIKQNHLYLVPLQKDAEGKREPRKLTAGDFNVGSGLGASPFDWSPDGKSIVFMHTRTPLANDWPTADVSIVDVATGEVQPLVATPAEESCPLYSPDGRWIALTISENPPRWMDHTTLHVVASEGGTPRPLAATFDGQPAPIGWSADGRRILFSEARGTATQIYAIDVETDEITELNPAAGICYDIHLNAVRTTLGFTMQTSDRAEEAHVTPVDRFEPVQVSRANADIPRLPIGRTEVVRWQSTDGMEIEGLLTYPVDFEPGRRVPLLLIVHGGPTGVFGQTFIAQPSLYPTAVFAARGYAVLRANPRGSSGYGKSFRYANEGDWGGGDYRDLMCGVDHVIAMGVADPERLGVMGWSYGGFMTSWILTQTKRFKAASVGAAVTNLMSFNGTADIPDFVPDYFGAQSWENLETYRSHSAMFQVAGVTTPALIQHGEADVRVPIAQGYEFYNALRAQGVPVRMLILPRQPHGPNEPRMTLKVMQSNVDWFDEHLRTDVSE